MVCDLCDRQGSEDNEIVRGECCGIETYYHAEGCNAMTILTTGTSTTGQCWAELIEGSTKITLLVGTDGIHLHSTYSGNNDFANDCRLRHLDQLIPAIKRELAKDNAEWKKHPVNRTKVGSEYFQ